MCYDAKSSITNYIYVGLITLILCLYGNKYDQHVALFFFVVIQIQLAEFFMHIDQKCGWINKFATIFAFVVLIAQPICSYLLGYILDTTTIPEYFKYFYLIYGLFGLTKLIFYLKNNRIICSKIKNGHLEWGFKPASHNINGVIILTMYLLATAIIPFIYLNSDVEKYLVIFLLLGSLFLHYVYNPNHWRTKWCFYSSVSVTIYAIYVIFRNMYKDKTV